MPRPARILDFPEELRDLVSYSPYQGYFDRIVDGDTYVIVLSVGCDQYPPVAIRLEGVDCPEPYEPGGPEATEFVESLCPPGEPCVVTTRKTPRSRREERTFTRYVGSVRLAEGRDLGEEIVRSGHGVFSSASAEAKPEETP